MSPRNSASKSGLPLALLVLRVGANHAHHAAPVNHFALVANLFNRCPYFHFLSLLLSRWRDELDRKSTRLNSSHQIISYAVFCLKKKSSSTPALLPLPTS